MAGRAAGDFAARGFLERSAGVARFFAPDADVLLDDAFAQTHCFGNAGQDPSHNGAVGLTFEPAKGRDHLVEVVGTLWMDASRPALQSIEYRYVGNDSSIAAGTATGRIHFQSLVNGASFVDTWSLRIPALEQRSLPQKLLPSGTRTARSTTFALTGQVGETGGTVTDATWQDGQHWSANVQSLVGRVLSDKDDVPAPGVVVALPATGDTVITDSAGRFAITPVFPGIYDVSLTDTAMSTYLSPRESHHSMRVSEDRLDTLLVRVPDRLSALYALCSAATKTDRRSVLLGRVVLADGSQSPLTGKLTISARWFDGRAATSGNSLLAGMDEQNIEADESGRFAACEVPPERVIRLTLRRDGVPLADTLLTLPTRNVAQMIWPINPQTKLRTAATASLAGIVSSDRRPITGAAVWVPSLNRTAQTDTAGRFILRDLPVGFTLLQIRRLGYGVLRDTITLIAGHEESREYALSSTIAMLDTLKTVARGSLSPAIREFEQRRERHDGGYFIADSALRAADGKTLASILTAHVSGLSLVPSQGGGALMLSNRKQCKGRTLELCKRPDCFVTVYLDGVRIYSAATDADPIDAARLYVRDLAGVEFYPTSAVGPAAYNATDTGCGTLLLWTRDR